MFFARNDLVLAWQSLEGVNWWILSLTIIAVMVGHIAAGEMMFSYLRKVSKNAKLPPTQAVRLSMEMNFVNHVLPSGGVSGLSYMTWRLGTIGVSASKAAMAQVVRYSMQFASFITLLIVSVIVMTYGHMVNRYVLLLSAVLMVSMVSVMATVIFVIGNKCRIEKFSAWINRVLNKIIILVTFGKKKSPLKKSTINKFFTDLHTDYVDLKKHKANLILPFFWGIIANVADIALFMFVFWAMGSSANPAPVFIAYGLASLSGVLIATPGGVGAYELIMVSFLAMAGVEGSVAIAGILVARVILMLITIGVGYVFYQHALIQYGRKK